MLIATKTFGREWLRNPRQIGAVTPSSKRLAMAMASGISERSGPVIELGPGTGVITRALLQRGLDPQEIAAIELSERFAEALKHKYPQLDVIHGDAGEVARLSPFELGSVGYVICGLPLVNLPRDLAETILVGSFKTLRPGGAFRLFTYSHRCPVSQSIRHRLGLKAVRISRTLRNIPPATIYELRRIK